MLPLIQKTFEELTPHYYSKRWSISAISLSLTITSDYRTYHWKELSCNTHLPSPASAHCGGAAHAHAPLAHMYYTELYRCRICIAVVFVVSPPLGIQLRECAVALERLARGTNRHLHLTLTLLPWARCHHSPFSYKWRFSSAGLASPFRLRNAGPLKGAVPLIRKR